MLGKIIGKKKPEMPEMSEMPEMPRKLTNEDPLAYMRKNLEWHEWHELYKMNKMDTRPRRGPDKARMGFNLKKHLNQNKKTILIVLFILISITFGTFMILAATQPEQIDSTGKITKKYGEWFGWFIGLIISSSVLCYLIHFYT